MTKPKQARAGKGDKSEGAAERSQAPHFRLHRAAEIVVYAELFGNQRAADRYGVALPTVKRKVQESSRLPELAAIVEEKRKTALTEVGSDFVRFLRRGAAWLEQIVDKAGPEDIRQIAGAMKIVGELEIARNFAGNLRGQQPRNHPEAAKPPAVLRGNRGEPANRDPGAAEQAGPVKH